MDLNLCQGDTTTLNYTILGQDLTFKTVLFVFSDLLGFIHTIICTAQSVTIPGYKQLSEGGISIPFVSADSVNIFGVYFAQFLITDSNLNQITYPLDGYLTISVQKKLT